MVRKIIKNLCLILFMLLSVWTLTACCAPDDCTINIVFNNIDERIGVSTYSETVAFGEGLIVEFTIPEGYDCDELIAKVEDLEFPCTITLEDESVAKGYEYSTAKNVVLGLNKITRDFDLVFDMSEVTKRTFDITLNKEVLSASTCKNDDGEAVSNMKVVTFDSEYATHLVELSEDIVRDTISFVDGTATIEYGEYAIICYEKQELNATISDLYSYTGHFTEEEKINTYNNIDYVHYPVAIRGNTYYNLHENGAVNTKSRLFYIGKIQEDLSIIKNIPTYVEQKGFVLDNSENKFSLLTNRQDYNSDLLTIDIYGLSDVAYTANDDRLDKVGGNTIKKIEKYSSAENKVLKNSDVMYEYINRYDVTNMYIGDNIEEDSLLSENEKVSLSSKLYISIKCEVELENLDIMLLTYEKQLSNDFPMLILTNTIVSEKGQVLFELDKSVLADFIFDRAEETSSGVVNYQVGNAILKVGMKTTYIDNSRFSGTFEYSVINYPLTLNSDTCKTDHDYQLQFYILNDDGSRDYGFVDMQKYSEDLVYFRTDKLWDEDGKFKENVYLNIIGPEYNDFYNPVINRIYLYLNYDWPLTTDGIAIENAQEFDGMLNIPVDISGQEQKPYPGDQYRIKINLTITSINETRMQLDFENMNFNNYTDAIYVTSNFDFEDFNDFQRIDNLSKTTHNPVYFGKSTDLYYFVVAEEDLDFDVIVGEMQGEDYVASSNPERIISDSKQLFDIAGNAVTVFLNGKLYNVYVKYQAYDIFQVMGTNHWAFNSNN